MQIPRRKADELKSRDEGPLYITEEGLERLRKKLEHLKSIVPDLALEAARTAAYGDRSDNAEYKQAKGSLRHANWNILSIEDQIKRAVVIPKGPNASGTVRIGSIVVLEVRGAKKQFEILGSHETDPTHGRISYKSPLGVALMDHVQGDVVTIKTEKGSEEYRILEIH
jgi:transcription elongation GreA/GreB family factor